MKKMVIDTAHSEIGFKVKHLMISTVKGNFGNFNGEVDSNGNVNFSLDVSSINTNNTDRDNHLKSADFFDVENHPTVTFVSNGVDLQGETISGELTIKGITKTVEFKSEYNGKSVDPWGNTKHGFEISGTISRSDFGLTWNAALETGGVLVSELVSINLDIQLLEVVEQEEAQMA